MEKVNIKAVFTQFVLAGGLLKSFAISGNETFKTASFNTLKKIKCKAKLKFGCVVNSIVNRMYSHFIPPIMRADVVYRVNDTLPSFN